MKFETKNYKLQCPVDVEVTTGEGDDAVTETVNITEVNISTPKGKQMRQITRLVGKAESDPVNYSDGDMTLDSIQIMSDLPDGAIDELHMADITALGDIIAPFLELALGGGGASSGNSPDGSAKTKLK